MESLLRLNQVLEQVGLSRSMLYLLQNDHFTGFMIGGGKIAARAYDKVFEIEKKSKRPGCIQSGE